MSLYRCYIGIDGKGLFEVILNAVSGTSALRQARRSANRIKGHLTYVALMENNKDRVVYQALRQENGQEISSIGGEKQYGKLKEVGPGIQNRGDNVSVEGSPDVTQVEQTGGADPGASGEHNSSGSSDPESV